MFGAYLSILYTRYSYQCVITVASPKSKIHVLYIMYCDKKHAYVLMCCYKTTLIVYKTTLAVIIPYQGVIS